MTKENPKLFISYSWSNHDHEQWVIDLASRLRESGVDVILDKWDLKEGHDTLAFMEKMVNDPEIKKVILICDRIYTEKADGRSGGVGTETQIISPEIYEKQDQGKFVAVLSEKDEAGRPYLPTYYKSRVYIDLSNNDLYASNYEQLLRWIYDKPLHIKPELGAKPSFLSEGKPILLGTTLMSQRALDAVRSGKEYAFGAVEEFYSTLVTNLEKFRLAETEGEIDDRIIENISRFLPYKNEAVEMFLNVSRYHDSPEASQQLHRFFESLIPYMFNPKHLTSYRESDFDNFKFIIHELFLSAITALIKYGRFGSAAFLLKHYYYVERNAEYGRNTMVPFTIFRQPLRSLLYRNDRLKLNRLSIQADLLVQRANTPGITDHQIMQADLVLFLRDAFDSLKSGVRKGWYPVTLVYAEDYPGAFELFARAQSKEYFDKIKILFDVNNKEDFSPLVEAFESDKLVIPRGSLVSINPLFLIGLDKLATLP